MTYKLNPIVSKITSPIIAIFEGEERYYDNGTTLAFACFDKKYIIESISAKNDKVIIFLKENNIVHNTNWLGEEEISFF